MVLPALLAGSSQIARVVAAASPAGFKALDLACQALEADALAGVRAVSQGVEVIPGKQEPIEGAATFALVAFRTACDTRKALRGRRK